MASIHKHDDFDEEKAAGILRKAMKGAGTDEKAIIDVLCSHDNEQRLKIRKAYMTLFGRELIKDLKSELSGHFEDVAVGLVQGPFEYLANELRSAMKGAGTDESVLIEILCTRSNKEIKAIKDVYELMFKRELEEDIASETGGNFRRLLISQVNAGRDESDDVDDKKALEDAKEIFEAGEAVMGTDESVFNKVLCRRSFVQLRETFTNYGRVSGKDIEETIKHEMSGTLQEGFLALVQCVKNVHAYYAQLLYHAIKGAGTKDQRLIRVIVSRCEVDMEEIRTAFMLKYKKSLPDFIKGDLSGDYKKIVLRILGD